MKNIIKYISIIVLCIASFYYTNKVALYVREKNPLIKEIKEHKDELYVSSIDGTIINDLYIIPGINGKEVNVNASYFNMKKSTYNKELVIYNQITPDLSIANNKDKIIIRGNERKKAVSLIFEENNSLTNYIIAKKYKVNFLQKDEKYINELEMINASEETNIYNKIEKYLNKNKINTNLCLSGNTICNDKYHFNYSLVINNSNLDKIKQELNSGEIILIKSNTSLENLIFVLNYIESLNLKIVPLSKLISEYIN